jgi:hypothetical protein
VTSDEIEQLAKELEALAKARRTFAATKGFDPRTHTAAADAYDHAAVLVRRAAKP